MKAYLKFISTILFLSFLLFESIVFTILCFPAGRFHSSYQSVIQDKYRILKETNSPKIIVIGGSNTAFGLDQKRLEQATGYPVVNLGLHAGFGHIFYTELAKANINNGDIILLAYEHTWPYGFDTMDLSLVMSGIDNNLEMYTHVPIEWWDDCIGYLFQYAEIKNTYEDATGIYSREAFDNTTAQMIMPRNYQIEYNPDIYGKVDLSTVSISDKTFTYLTSFKNYAEKRGARLYFVAPPLVKNAVICDYNAFDHLKNLEETQIGIPYISDQKDYLFPEELMLDSLYHCNSKGEQVRTELLISDLKKAEIIP